ncbi:MAG: allophanate hydrolase subunit 1 [Mycobacteriaceae bacterium]
MSEAQLLACGDAAVLLEVADLDAVLAVTAAVEAVREELALLDVVPGARTVLVTVAPGRALGPLRERLGRLATDAAATAATSARSTRSGHETTIEVVYDGPDLDDVATLTGLTRSEVVAAHTGTPWRVGFGGFAPGFAYLVGGDPRLEVPRRDESRTSVPAGSVGLAGEFSGVYPRASPGGWQLLGRTAAALFDLDRDPPALLRAGGLVRFVAVGQ